MNIQTELFESALCIEKPLYISNIEFNELSELHIYIDFERGSKFLCPVYLEAGNLKINTIC